MKQATGFLRKASIFRKSQLPQAVTPAPVKEAPEAKQDEIQGTFAGLPDEVHIAILCEGLEPRDLIAVSHTCQALHTCASWNIAWRCAWPRSPERLAPLEPPPLVLPGAELLVRGTFPKESLLGPTTTQPIQWLGAYDPARSNLLRSSFRAKYLEIMRVRHRLRQPKLVMQPLALVRDVSSSDQLIESSETFTPGGEVLVCWTQRGLLMFDIRYGIQYIVPLQYKSANASALQPATIVAQIFTYEGSEGLLLVAPFFKQDQLNVVFQPFVASQTTKPPPLKHLGHLPPCRRLDALTIKSHYLIYREESASRRTKLRIIDLHIGREMSLYCPFYSRDPEIFNDEIIFFHDFGGTMFSAQLSVLDADADVSPPPQSWLGLDFPTITNVWMLTSVQTRFDPVSKQPVLFIWFLAEVEGLPRKMHLIKIGEPYVDSRDGGIRPRPTGPPIIYTAPFTHDLFSDDTDYGHDEFGKITRSNLKARGRVGAAPGESYDPPHTNCTRGNSAPLSHIVRMGRRGVWDGTTTVLTSLDKSGRLVHKPLHISTPKESQRGRRGAKPASAEEQFAQWSSLKDTILWNELSGRLAVENSSWRTNTLSFTIYQF